MNNYVNFFSPPTISIVFCLNQLGKNAAQFDANNKIVRFVISKIMKLNQQTGCSTNQQFQAQLLSVTDDIKFLGLYRAEVESIECLNDFYRFLSSTLKSLRMLKNSKTEQGNIIDLFLRRLILYFSKFDFKELVTIYNQFDHYKNNHNVQQLHNDFTVSKKLELLRFTIENYSFAHTYQTIDRQLKQIQPFDNNFKVFYLKALNEANGNKPLSSTNNMHKYFDKSLGNLFHEKNEITLQSNNVNHCILSLAYINLKLGFIDESLKSISQGLRISQNNSDPQSINHCIIYLYQIAGYLGMHNEQILLTQHAITHSLNLNNILLMLFSCLSYSQIQKHYDRSNKQVDVLTSRNLNWTDALHFSKKKIYSNFENSCKSLFHSERNLMIPNFLHKLAIITHLPQLKGLYLESLKDQPELMHLDKYKLFLAQNESDDLIKSISIMHFRTQTFKVNQLLSRLQHLVKFIYEPVTIIKIWAFRNTLLIDEANILEAYTSVQSLILWCKNKGFVKEYLIQQYLNLVNIQIINANYLEALTVIEEVIALSKAYGIQHSFLTARIYKAKVYIKLGYLTYPVALLRKVEESGHLVNLPRHILSLFDETKAESLTQLFNVMLQSKLHQECKKLQHSIDSLYMHAIKLTLEQLNFAKLLKLLQIRFNVCKDPCQKQKTAQAIDYLQKTLDYFRKQTLDYPINQSLSLSEKIKVKIQNLLQ